jgi:hypothetical protein
MSKKVKVSLLIILILIFSVIVFNFHKEFISYFQVEKTKQEQVVEEENESQEISEDKENIEQKTYQELVLDTEINEEFKQAVIQLDASEKLIGFLNQTFIFETKNENIALTPQEFFEKKKGGEIDFAVFIAHILDYHHYEVSVVRYEFIFNDQKSVNTIVVFRDKDLPKYIFFSQGKIFIAHHGWSFNELFQSEEKRLNIKINRFALFYPNVFDLTLKELEKR